MEFKDIKKVMRVTYNKWQISGYTNGLNYLLKIKENFETAAWTIIQKGGKDVNVIYIGDKALEMSNDLGNKKRLLGNLLYHEFGHSKFTSQDFERLEIELKKIYAKFELFNLFEDVRMEHKVRELTEHRFNWFNYVNPYFMGVGHDSPESLLLALKNAEAHLSSENTEIVYQAYIESYVESHEDIEEVEARMDADETYDRVLDYYYPKVLEAEETFDLIPIMKEWLDEFYDENQLKREQEQQERLEELAQAIAEAMKEAGLEGSFVPGSGLEVPQDDSDEEKEGGDLQEAKGSCENPQAGTIDEDSEEVAGNVMTKVSLGNQSGKSNDSKDSDPQNIGGGNKRDDVETETVIIDEFTSGDLLQYCRDDRSERLDINLAKKLLPIFARFLKNNARTQAVSRPSKRLSTRNVMLDRDKIYKRKIENVKADKKISLVVDCSGSMYYVMPDMKVVMWVVNQLAKQGRIEGNIILSAAQGYQTIKMPMKDEDLDSISGFSGSEGLAHTFEATKSFLKKQDYVFCLTDGDINDRAIDKKSLAKQGVRPIGIYIGEEAKSLKNWFDRYVNRQDAKSTIDEIARKLK